MRLKSQRLDKTLAVATAGTSSAPPLTVEDPGVVGDPWECFHLFYQSGHKVANHTAVHTHSIQISCSGTTADVICDLSNLEIIAVPGCYC